MPKKENPPEQKFPTIDDFLKKQMEIIQKKQDTDQKLQLIESINEKKQNSTATDHVLLKAMSLLEKKENPENTQISMVEMMRLQNEAHQSMLQNMLNTQKEQQSILLMLFQQQNTTPKDNPWDKIASLASKMIENPFVQKFLTKINNPNETPIDKIFPIMAENLFSFQSKAMESMLTAMAKQQPILNTGEMQSKLAYYKELMNIVAPAIKETFGFLANFFIKPNIPDIIPVQQNPIPTTTTNPTQNHQQNISSVPVVSQPQEDLQRQKYINEIEKGIRIIYTTKDFENAVKQIKEQTPTFCELLLKTPKAERDAFLTQYGLDTTVVDNVCNILSSQTKVKETTPIQPTQPTQQTTQTI